MSTYKTPGIILKRKNIGETDKILTVYTQTKGKINLIAKGIRKVLSKLSGHLELFYLSDFFIAEGKQIDTVAGAQIINNFPRIHASPKKIKYSYYIAETTDRLIKSEEKSLDIYNLLLLTLDNIERNQFNDDLCLFFFQIHMLDFLGHRPELNHCVKCQKSLDLEINFFSFHLGGIICENCHKYDLDSYIINNNSIKLMRLFLESKNLNNIKNANKEIKELLKILQNFIEWIGEKKINSAKYL